MSVSPWPQARGCSSRACSDSCLCLCSYYVGMCGDGANDCGVSAPPLPFPSLGHPPLQRGSAEFFSCSTDRH